MEIDRKAALEGTSDQCAYCGCPITIEEMHINCESKLACCADCDNLKGGLTVGEFHVKISSQIDKARKESESFNICERFGLIEVSEEKNFYFWFEIWDEL